MRALFCLFLSLPLAACEEQGAAPVQEKASPVSSADWKSYGDPLGQSPKVELTTLLRDPAAYAGKQVSVEGSVRRACSAKGCWMELADGNGAKAAGCRVTFKDYGFFVPTDSAGSLARLEAVVEVETVKKSHVEHMEGEGATFENKNSDGTAREVRLVASGVQLKRPM